MPLMEISIVPVGGQTCSFSSVVKDVESLVENRGFSHQVTPTATVIEGELDPLLSLASDIHRSTLQNGTQRVITQIIIDDRQDQPMNMQSQVSKVKGN
ncbi:MTH1187 family thiamine-binding protein [Paludifilum halophilum]|uniref:Thiamine-binding protein domain-containing protein n=1 Tax=Paludifilum halophilum TaxID=1642702 RepID=A0A235BAX9_9BACL|nr:MTH1187 family thiamine-binding protein [Paludifilum halophilum]OYD09149.1 hypothetical protein CHM34_05145 [Paludifilum halophilum]